MWCISQRRPGNQEITLIASHGLSLIEMDTSTARYTLDIGLYPLQWYRAGDDLQSLLQQVSLPWAHHQNCLDTSAVPQNGAPLVWPPHKSHQVHAVYQKKPYTCNRISWSLQQFCTAEGRITPTLQICILLSHPRHQSKWCSSMPCRSGTYFMSCVRT